MHAANASLQTADRALQVLSRFHRFGDAFTVSEIGAGLGVHRSTASRLVSTLVGRGFLERIPGERVRLGPETVRLGRIALPGTELVAVATPILDALAAGTGEATTLAVAAGDQVLTVAEARSRHFISSRDWIGVQTGTHCTADGKVLLAFGAIAVPSAPLVALTPRTIVDVDQLVAECHQVRARGYAQARGELEPGLHGVAVPVHDAGTCIAALCVSGPEYRLGGDFAAALAPQCQAAAATLSRRLREAREHAGASAA